MESCPRFDVLFGKAMLGYLFYKSLDMQYESFFYRAFICFPSFFTCLEPNMSSMDILATLYSALFIAKNPYSILCFIPQLAQPGQFCWSSRRAYSIQILRTRHRTDQLRNYLCILHEKTVIEKLPSLYAILIHKL